MIPRAIVYVPGHQFGVGETAGVVRARIDDGESWLYLTTNDLQADDGKISVRASQVSAVVPINGDDAT